MSASAQIVEFRAEHGPAFKALNLAWISEHWEPEAADFKALDDPQGHVIDPGGYIAIAEQDGQVVGSCALIKMDDSTFELAKMAVDPAAKGQGLGRLLGEAVIARARELGATRIYLESNSVLRPALQLYKSLGFQLVENQPTPYARCDVQMSLTL